MFTNKEKGLIDKAYFKIVRETEGFVECSGWHKL